MMLKATVFQWALISFYNFILVNYTLKKGHFGRIHLKLKVGFNN